MVDFVVADAVVQEATKPSREQVTSWFWLALAGSRRSSALLDHSATVAAGHRGAGDRHRLLPAACLHTAWFLTNGQMQVIEVLASALTSCLLFTAYTLLTHCVLFKPWLLQVIEVLATGTVCVLLPAACLRTAYF